MRIYLTALLLCFAMTLINAKEGYKFTVPKVFKLGETIRLDIHSPEPLKKGSAILRNKKFTLFKKGEKGNHYYGYLGMSRHAKPGLYTLKIYLDEGKEKAYLKKIKIQVTDPKFGKGKVVLRGKKKKLVKKTTQLKDEGKIIGQKFRTLTAKQYFNEPFAVPVNGRVTSTFGKLRSYTGKWPNRHSGVDLASEKGDIINAPNAGRIILSEMFPVHGETVMIDHGLGVITIYNHLSKRLVKEGKSVKKGDPIGRMGQTGLASGVHVHWGMSIQNIRVDPLFWVNNGFFQ